MGEYKLVRIKSRINTLKWVACFISISIIGNLSHIANTANLTVVHVSLLGQPCLLQGPFEEDILKKIHSMGPAQIYPNISSQNIPSSIDQTRKALDKIRSSANLHELLDRYREKLRKRLEAQNAFMTALNQSQKSKDFAAVLKTARLYLQDRDFRSFDSLIKKVYSSDKNGHTSLETLDSLIELFNDSIEPDPEGEFHRAIKKLGIQYICSFEENEESASDK